MRIILELLLQARYQISLCNQYVIEFNDTTRVRIAANLLRYMTNCAWSVTDTSYVYMDELLQIAVRVLRESACN
jgi:hypothetical protein